MYKKAISAKLLFKDVEIIVLFEPENPIKINVEMPKGINATYNSTHLESDFFLTK
jgi:hypothetical protein